MKLKLSTSKTFNPLTGERLHNPSISLYRISALTSHSFSSFLSGNLFAGSLLRRVKAQTTPILDGERSSEVWKFSSQILRMQRSRRS